ncbi:MAG: phosphate-binding protein [Candidatus Saganbacteria bacterium]|uniref:Phosphate-binding protein n=1 Tax=Candidatus Saganbacteria bacterium TaxID=2575572 RepID=A0A833KZZ0_UNCSA|nr:MAG: phosphate-binding protein [Candidatus Saganbacteria bacterium]
MFKLMRFSLFLLFLITALAVIAGCTRSGDKAIQIKGSDTMVNLGQAWSEEFIKDHPEIPIAVTGGGSGTGIAALMSNSCDIAQSSRQMEKKEIELAKKRGIEPKEFHAANDGIAVVVHPSNPVKRLTIKQLSEIFTGKIKNWLELGGIDKNIVILSRERNSGTHVFFLEHVVKFGDKKNKNEFAPQALMMPSSQAIAEEILHNRAAIGYFGLGYLTKKQKVIAIAKKDGSPYVLPSIETVLNKSYPISRSLLLYTNGKPSEKVTSFIDFILSKKGQEIVKKMDFVPIK